LEGKINFLGGALKWNFVHHHHGKPVFVLGFGLGWFWLRKSVGHS